MMEPCDGRIPHAATIVDVLMERARLGEAGGFAFLDDGESVSESLSWSELAEAVCTVSAALREHAGHGDRALLFFRPGLGFLIGFLGCLHAGVVAVPCVPPSRPLKRSFERINEVARVSSPRVIVASGKALVGAERELHALCPLLASCPVVDPRGLRRVGVMSRSVAEPDDVAFLQFTSGSTSAPKGVVVTHANLMNNLGYIHECFGHDRRSISVTWLPVFHDMGLVDGMLEPVFGGFRCFAMPPHAFIQRPGRWLRAISRNRATHSGGPNFAYDLCIEKVPPAEVGEIDLSSLRVAYNGAEPVRVSTMERFARHFAPCGFRMDAFHPCYGLAEATLKVTGGSATTLKNRVFDAGALECGTLQEVLPTAPRARTVASCGPVFRDFELAIVDPESERAREEGQLGEIWLSGPSVTAGYYGNAEATEAAFGRRTKPDGRGPFLRTGDLGFMMGGELYVAGRLKDLIILSGRNLYPQDIERTVESADASLAPGCAAAFSMDDGQRERMVVLLECSAPRDSESDANHRRFENVVDAVRRAIAREHLVEPSVVAVIRRGELLKTTSGKLRRRACREAYSEGSMSVIEEFAYEAEGAAQ